MKKIVLLLLTIITCSRLSAGDYFCGIRNTTFNAGESITYNVFYNIIGIYVNAGTANFTTKRLITNQPIM